MVTMQRPEADPTGDDRLDINTVLWERDRGVKRSRRTHKDKPLLDSRSVNLLYMSLYL